MAGKFPFLRGEGTEGENIRAFRQAGHSEAEAVSLTLQRQSLDQRMDRVRSAVQEALRPPKTKGEDMHGCCAPSIGGDPYPYVKEVFDTYAIVEQGDKLFKVAYTDTGSKVTVGSKTPVKQTYVPVSAAVDEGGGDDPDPVTAGDE